MNDVPEPDTPREQALHDAVADLAAAVARGDATDEELEGAIEAVRQVPIDMQRMLNALHVPADAGGHEDVLRSLLMRIPDGWGRWISCGSGWYPILARLDDRLRAIDPDYEVYQIKEKFGTLRFYWSGCGGAASREAVADAEAESARTCELCSTPARLKVSPTGWYRTLCEACSAQRGYSDMPDEEE